MTHTEDLIFRLRDTASRGVSSWGDLQQEAADHIAGQDLLIAVLKKQLPTAVAAEREKSLKLWMLLDDIDTADDIAKADDVDYRRLCRQAHKKRWDVLSGDDVDNASRARGEA